jgi:hypothetical protein
MVGKDGGTTSSSTSGVTQPTRAFDQMMTASLLQNPQIVAGMTASLHQLAGQHKHGGAGGAGAPTAKRRRIQTSTGQHPLSAVSLVPAGGLEQPARFMAWSADLNCIFEKTPSAGWPSMAVSLLTGAVDPSRTWICRCGGACKTDKLAGLECNVKALVRSGRELAVYNRNLAQLVQARALVQDHTLQRILESQLAQRMKLWSAIKEVKAFESSGESDVPIPAMMRWAVLIQSGGALQDGLRQAYQNTNWYYASVYAELNRSGLPVEPQSASALGPAWHMQPPPPKL